MKVHHNDQIIKSQIRYFGNLYKKYQGTPMEVSSESLVHKNLRFSKISQIFKNEKYIQVHDIGMGLGDFFKYLKRTFPKKRIEYSGSEIVSEYVKTCKKTFPECKFYERDLSEKQTKKKYDFIVMSGVFHQKRNSNIPEWEKFSQKLLKNSFSMCRKGIAFNFVSPFVDFYQTQIYYCNLLKLINFINDNLSRFFTIEHNYALFEFTVFVYKQSYIKNKYKEKEFQKYFK